MVFGLFSKDRALKRAIKKAHNKLAQSPDRWAALEKLRDDGSEEALYALFKRFSITSTKLSEDEAEKEWVMQTLVGKMDMAIAPGRRYMKNATAISYPLRVLETICTGDKALEIIDEVIEDNEPGYARDPTKKIDLLTFLAEWKGAPDEEVVKRVIPYLEDHDDNVRYAAAEVIAHRPLDIAAEPLVNALINEDEESGRFKVRIAEVMADNNMELCGQKKAVSELLKTELTDFRMQKNKLARKAGAKK